MSSVKKSKVAARLKILFFVSLIYVIPRKLNVDASTRRDLLTLFAFAPQHELCGLVSLVLKLSLYAVFKLKQWTPEYYVS